MGSFTTDNFGFSATPTRCIQIPKVTNRSYQLPGANTGFEFGQQYKCSDFSECHEPSEWSETSSWGSGSKLWPQMA